VPVTGLVKLIVPAQPAADGVIVIVPNIADVLGSAAVKDAIFPNPVAPRPIAVFEFTQLNVVPATLPVNTSATVADPLHAAWLPGVTVNTGIGLIVIVMF
jgi:hypothetical protein